MKNILLCDANFCVLPILEIIQKKKFNLTVAGSLINDPCHALADHSVKLDYSNYNALLEHAEEKKYIGIVPGCNDQSYLSSSFVAEKLSLPGFDNYETALIIHHKDKFRAFAEEHQYSIPKAIDNINDISKLNFPILIKPIDSFSGKGISKAYNIDEATTFWAQAKSFSSEGAVIAEEFIEGELYSHSAFIKNKKILIDFFVNEYCTVYPYQVNSSNVSTVLEDNIKIQLKNWTEQFADDLNLCDGLIHTQFLVKGANFYLIEVARRSPGDLYSQLIKKSTGVDYAELYVLPFCNIELPEKVITVTEKYISRHTVTTDKDCIFISTKLNVDSLNSLYIPLKNTGEIMKKAPFGKSGIYFIEHKSEVEMELLTKNLKEFIEIETLNL